MLITKLDHQGRGIGKINNKVIFVPRVLPGEDVDIVITNEKKKFAEGKLIKIIKASPNRIVPLCPYYENCGGCNLMHLSYSEQLKYKQEKINNIITKYVANNVEIKDIIACDDIYNYRNKIKLHVNQYIGLYKEDSHELVKINNCMLVDNKINSIIKELNCKRLANDEITIRCNGKETLLFYKNEKNDLHHIASDNIILNNQTIKGNNYIIESLNGVQFKISPSSFFQVNTKQTIKMYNIIKQLGQIKKTDKILDLYCGTGSIGLYLSKYCKEILGIEINQDAIKDANENIILNNIKNAKFIVDDAKNAIKKISFQPDLLIIDPPRSGLFKGMIEDIYKFKAPKIIYVSCDPLTLARDLKELKEKYQIISVQPIDLFPNTHHIENVVLLYRK